MVSCEHMKIILKIIENIYNKISSPIDYFPMRSRLWICKISGSTPALNFKFETLECCCTLSYKNKPAIRCFHNIPNHYWKLILELWDAAVIRIFLECILQHTTNISEMCCVHTAAMTRSSGHIPTFPAAKQGSFWPLTVSLKHHPAFQETVSTSI